MTTGTDYTAVEAALRRAGGELDDYRRLLIRDGLFGLGVLAPIAFLSRLFRRFGATQPVWIECDELQRRLTAGDKVLLLDVRQPMSSPRHQSFAGHSQCATGRTG